MLDPNKMTAQYQRVLSQNPNRWYFVNPTDPKLEWRHRYKKVFLPGTYFLPHTFPSHPNQRKFLLQDVSTAHFKFTKSEPHDLFIHIINGKNEYRLTDDGAALMHHARRLIIYNSGIPFKHGVLYRDFPQIRGRQNVRKNLHIMMYHLCDFTNEIMSLISCS